MNSNNPQKSSPFFYGWIIALISGIGIMFSISVFIPATNGIMASYLTEEFGWLQSEIVFGTSFATFATILVAPFLGAIVDKFGARRVITFSFVLEALIVASFCYVDGHLWLYYARYAALAIFATGTTAVPFNRIISRWFNLRRGVAISIAMACYGLGGVVWSKLTPVLFNIFGWRNAFLAMAVILMFIILPIILIFIRETPESIGSTIDGLPESPESKSAPKVDTIGLSLGKAISEIQFWKIAIGFFFISFALQSIVLQITPMMITHGLEPATAYNIQAYLWLAMIFGRMTTGVLMDRMFAPYVGIIFSIPAIIGIFILSGSPTLSVGVAALGAICIGMANGCEADIIPYITGRYFGLKHYTKIYGTFFSCFCLGSAAGPPITAKLIETTGGFHIMLWTHTGAILLACAILFTFARFPESNPA